MRDNLIRGYVFLSLGVLFFIVDISILAIPFNAMAGVCFLSEIIRNR
jgi:hypothetical protein